MLNLLLATVLTVMGIPSLDYINNALNTAALYDTLACTDENRTYLIDIKIHADDLSIKALTSLASNGSDNLPPEELTVKMYFGTIIDELNEYLIRFKVQLSMNLNGYQTDAFLGNVASDKSCELASAVETRTTSAYDSLKKSFENNMGLHLFVWVCPYLPNGMDLVTVIENEMCGRVMGVMWKGSQETRLLVKTVILNALIKGRNERISDREEYDRDIGPKLCNYATSCIGTELSEIGQKVEGTKIVSFTQDV